MLTGTGGWGPGGRRGVFAPQVLHSYQQAPGTTQACSFGQAEEGRAKSGSFEPFFLPCLMTRRTRHPSRLIEAMEHSIIQWNVRGFQANFEELALLSRKYKPAVFGLQETFLTSSKTPTFSGFNILTKNSLNDRATGGVALLINKSYLFSEVHLNTPLQAVAARVTLNKVVNFCRIYLPPSDHVAKTDLINLIEQLPSPFVLLGNFNGHSPVWGNESYNRRGQMLEDLFSEMNLCILNDGSSTYIHPDTASTSALDLSICGPSLVLDYEWNIHEDLCGSDHFPVILTSNAVEEEAAPNRWNFKKADCLSFQVQCTSELTEEAVMSAEGQFTY